MNLLPLFLAVFFPSLQELWEAAPLTAEFAPRSPSYIHDALLREQTECYKLLKDPRLRSVIARELAQSNNPNAFSTLEGLLKIEQDESCKADLLGSMLILAEMKLGKISSESGMKAFLNSPETTVRANAAALLLNLNNTSAAAAVLEHLRNEQSDYAANFIGARLVKQEGGKASLSDLRKIVDSASATDTAKAWAMRMIAQRDPSADSNPVLASALSAEKTLWKIRIAEGLGNNEKSGEKLLARLSAEKNPAIRIAVAGMSELSPEKEKILLRLAESDSSDLVRKTAVASLKHAGKPNDAIFNVLSRSMREKDRLIREAAVASLVKHKPPQDVLDQLAKLKTEKQGQYELVTLFRELNAKENAEDVADILAGADDDELRINCIEALGIMKDSNAVELLIGESDSKNDKLLLALAESFGKIGDKRSFDTLKKLAANSGSPSGSASVTAMGRIADPVFKNTVAAALKNYKASGDYRAAACWTLARLGTADDAMLKSLTTLILAKCIMMPMAPPAYDSDYVRASALLALLELSGKGNAKAKELFKESVSRIENATERELQEGFAGELLLEYLRQIKAMADGEKAKPVQVMPYQPELTVGKTK